MMNYPRLYLISLIILLAGSGLAAAQERVEPPEGSPNSASGRLAAPPEVPTTEDVDAARNLAAELARSSRFLEAQSILKELHERHPEDRQVLFDYVVTLAWSGQYAEAARLSANILALDPPEYALAAAAQAQRHSGNLQLAESFYRQGLAQFPRSPDFVAGLAMTLAEAERYSEARDVLLQNPLQPLPAPTAEATDEPSAAPPSVTVEAEAFIDRRMAEAEERDQQAQAGEAKRRRNQAVARARAGDYGPALMALQSLHEQHPDDQALLADYLTVAAWAGNNRKAAELADKIDWSTAPEYAYASLAASLRSSKHFSEARRWYERAVSRFPDSLDLRLGLALTMGEQKAPDRGLALLKNADRGASPADRRRVAEVRAYLNRMIPPPPPFVLPPAPKTAYRHAQEEAVNMAREGHLADALAILGDLHARHPRDQYLLGDYMVLLQWDRNHEKVIALSRYQDFSRAPAYAVAAVAQSLAASGNYAASERYLETALAVQRRYPELLATAAQVLALNGNFFKGAAWLEEAEASRTPGLGHLTQAVRRDIGYERILSLYDLEKANSQLSVNPRNQNARRLQVQALSGVGAALEARDKMGGVLDLDTGNIHDIEWATGLKYSGWGEQTSLTRLVYGRDQRLSTSVAVLNRLMARPDYGASDNCPRLGLISTVQPLYGLNKFQEAVEAYEVTRDQGQTAKEAVLLDAAGAYLGLKRPEEAAVAYQLVLDRRNREDPPVLSDDLYNAEKGLFWALLESEQLKEARQQAWENFNRRVNPEPGQKVYEDDDWQKTDVCIVAGLAELYTNHFDRAEDHFQKFVRQAPANAGGLAALAATKSMRGLPREARENVIMARQHAPDGLGLAIQEAQGLLDLRQWREAHTLIEQLAPWSPYSQAVKRLERRWETHNLREARVYINWSHSDGKNPGTVGSSDRPSVEWRLYSQPVAYNWRAFVGSAWDAGDFQEGKAYQELVLGGVEYRGPDLEVSLEARSDRVEDTRFGLGLSGVWEYDDHLRVPFSVEKLSRQTPLRARHSRITADSADIGLEYYWNDYRWLTLSAGFMDFSDDNQRQSLSGTFNQRLWTYYTHYLNGHLNAYTSHNTKDDDRPYFNPKDDREFGLGLTYGSLLWRNYDNALHHALTVSAGDYWQKYYGSDLVWNAAYSQTLDWTDRFSVSYGLGYGRRVYDGDPEKIFNAYLTLIWKF